jgi:hypothetical protein
VPVGQLPERPVRVAHVITSLDVGGAEMKLAGLVGLLTPHRIQRVVIVPGHSGSVAERVTRSGIPVFALGMRPGRPNPVKLRHLVRILRQLRPHILQTWLYHADLAGSITAGPAGVPRVVWKIRCAELEPRDHRRGLPILLRSRALASRWPSTVVANSVAGRRAHERLGYQDERLDRELATGSPDTGDHTSCAE